MYELPEHMASPINLEGEGPADPDEAVLMACWCADGVLCEVVPSEPIDRSTGAQTVSEMVERHRAKRAQRDQVEKERT